MYSNPCSAASSLSKILSGKSSHAHTMYRLSKQSAKTVAGKRAVRAVQVCTFSECCVTHVPLEPCSFSLGRQGGTTTLAVT